MQTASLVGHRVLIVDPHDASSSVLRELVIRLGCKSFAAATSYADAIAMLRRPDESVDLILCEFVLNGWHNGQHLLEELRANKLIPMRTAFFVVTGETRYRSVVSVADFAPDDYLVKPYSISQLEKRLTRMLHRKQMLASAYALMDKAEYTAAARECLRLAGTDRTLTSTCWRLAAQALMAHGDDVAAEKLLAKILSIRPLPWASLALAQVKARRNQLDEAAEMLAALLDTNPEFMRVYDELARMRLLQNRREEAVEILKRAAQKSGGNVSRMRQMAQLAEEMGDMTLAEETFGRILERTRDTGMLSGEDYTNAARVLIAQGKVDQAEKIAADQAKTMDGHPDQELSAAMLAFARTRRGDSTARQAAVRKLVEIEARDNASALSPRLVVQVISACLDNGLEDTAFQIAGRMAKRKGLDGTVMHEMQRLLDQHHEEVTRKQDKAAE